METLILFIKQKRAVNSKLLINSFNYCEVKKKQLSFFFLFRKILNLKLINNHTLFEFTQILIQHEYYFYAALTLKCIKTRNEFFYFEFGKLFFQAKKYRLSELYFKKTGDHPKLKEQMLRYLADIYKFFGFKDKSIKFYKESLNLNVNNTNAIYNLVNLDHDLDFIQKALDQVNYKNLPNNMKANYHYSLGLMYQKQGQFELSFKQFTIANDFKIVKSIDYTQHFEKSFEFSKIFYNKFNHIKFKTYSDQTPIFIVGLPRSGSTLVENIIGSHSKVKSFNEINNLGHTLRFFFNVYDQNVIIKEVDQFNIDLAYQFGKVYCKSVTRHKYFTDKMLFNFLYLGLINIVMPQAKIILSLRDYRDIATSMFSINFNDPRMFFVNDKKQLTQFFRLYHQIIFYWKKVINKNLFIINYETLVDDFESNVKKILKFCDLNEEKSCFEFYNNNNITDTASSNQVRKKPYKSSVGSYLKYYNCDKEFYDDLDALQKL